MSLELLSINWELICKKVLKPLWNSKYKMIYYAIKMDEADFMSMAGLELTKSFMTYNKEKSNILTYATTVINRKAMTEVRNMKRNKRKVGVISESLSQLIGDEGNKTIEDLFCVENINDKEEYMNEEIEELIKRDIIKILHSKEKKIFCMLVDGYIEEDIASILHINIREIRELKKKLSSSSEIRRILRMYEFLGGNDNEI